MLVVEVGFDETFVQFDYLAQGKMLSWRFIESSTGLNDLEEWDDASVAGGGSPAWFQPTINVSKSGVLNVTPFNPSCAISSSFPQAFLLFAPPSLYMPTSS